MIEEVQVKQGKKQVLTTTFPVHVQQSDIDAGECLKPSSCMVQVSLERTLRMAHPRTNHHSRVDAGHIKFNLEGYRYVADTPRKPKAALIAFDREDAARKAARKKGEPFKSKVEPFMFTITARRGAKIKATTPERQERINEARRKRRAAGQKQKQYTLRDRIVGFA
jgi:hypothetical protein